MRFQQGVCFSTFLKFPILAVALVVNTRCLPFRVGVYGHSLRRSRLQ